jgi:cytochrome c oxidase subunit IV
MAQHIVAPKTYLLVFAALMVLTAMTVWVAFIDWGILNIIIALVIAVTKATLVILIFMHVRYSSQITRLVVVGGIFWLLLLIVLTMSDYLTRGWYAVMGW